MKLFILLIYVLLAVCSNVNLFSQEDGAPGTSKNQKDNTEEAKSNNYLSLLINGSIKTNLSSETNVIGTGSIGARYVSPEEEITALISLNEGFSEQVEDSVQSFGDVVLIQAIRSGSITCDYKRFFNIFGSKKNRFGIGANLSANFSNWKIKTGIDSISTIPIFEKKKALVVMPNLNLYYRLLSVGFTSTANSKETETAESKLKAQKEIQKAKIKAIQDIDEKIKITTDSTSIAQLELLKNSLEEKEETGLTKSEINDLFNKLQTNTNKIDITLHLGFTSRFILGNIGFADSLRSKSLDGNLSKIYLGFEVGFNIEINNFNAFFNIPYLLPGKDSEINVRGLTRGQPVAGIEFRGDIWKIVNIK
ncbi:MAG: hypothetical protein IAE90_15455 [Ignavibacteria bacterium]|nr:hypothetical protein [Ignavibacteria bacterium]